MLVWLGCNELGVSSEGVRVEKESAIEWRWNSWSSYKLQEPNKSSGPFVTSWVLHSPFLPFLSVLFSVRVVLLSPLLPSSFRVVVLPISFFHLFSSLPNHPTLVVRLSFFFLLFLWWCCFRPSPFCLLVLGGGAFHLAAAVLTGHTDDPRTTVIALLGRQLKLRRSLILCSAILGTIGGRAQTT